MYRKTHYNRPSFGFGRTWTPVVKVLILANGGVFLAQLLLGRSLVEPFVLDTAHPLQLWRYGTYLFLHGSPLHLFFNMFALWIFGSEMEDYFGSRKFLHYYLFTGIGAGLSVAFIDLVVGQRSFVIGASGAVFGILLAYGLIYAERRITLLLFFVLPVTMKARHFVIIFGVLEFFFGVSGGSQIAHFAHLGGMAFGWLYMRFPVTFLPRRGPGIVQSAKTRVKSAMAGRDDKRMDELLKKVNTEGIQSLTESEKQFLHRMSRKKRWN